MKHKIAIIKGVCLFVMASLFYGMWQYEKNNQSNLLQMCKVGIADSLQFFTEYQDNREESSYTYGVASFNVF